MSAAQKTTKIIITGASRGIGRSLAQQMSKIASTKNQRSHLLLTATKREALEQVSQSCTNDQCAVSVICGDITEQSTVQELKQFVQEKWGGEINVLIHNAGVIDPICKISQLAEDPQLMDAFPRNVQVNFLSVVQMTSHLLHYLRAVRGNVLFVSSGAANRAIDGWSAYCCAKTALFRFADSLALEEKEHGINVISVRPGVVDTDMQRDIRSTGVDQMKDYEFFKELHEQKKLLDPNLTAERICPLALDIPAGWTGELVNHDDDKVIEHANKFYQQ